MAGALMFSQVPLRKGDSMYVTMALSRCGFLAVAACLCLASAAAAQEVEDQQAEDKLITTLNAKSVINVSETNRSYRALFDAALELTEAPSTSGGADSAFNLRTIHPKMSDWAAVSDWAEANPKLADAILAAKSKAVFGLPYGQGVDQKYLSNGMYADLSQEGNLRMQDFAYLDVIDTIAAFATAECYRRFEAGRTQDAIDLVVAQVFLNDQICDRLFLLEKLHAIDLQTDFLECARDMMYLYFDQISARQYAASEYEGDRKGLSFELPWLRVDLLEMPDGDYESAKAIVESVFGEDDLADPDRFASSFGRVQAEGRPFTQFGAAARWRLVANVHRSKLATLSQLELVYDDWWRRWGIRAYHRYLDLDPQYERINPIAYAAVAYSLRDINDIFLARRQLVAAVNGTALAAAVSGYKKQFGSAPDDLEKVYAVHVAKRTDLDPFDREARGFGYRRVASDRSEDIRVDEFDAFVEVVPSSGLLWARGEDFESGNGRTHSSEGMSGDIVYWPPLRALARQQGLVE